MRGASQMARYTMMNSMRHGGNSRDGRADPRNAMRDKGREMEYRGGRNDRGSEMAYDTEDRFRDRRGREHYDNGRFAPMRGENESWISDRGVNSPGRTSRYDMEDSGRNYPAPVYERGGQRMNLIGFSGNGGMREEMGGAYRSEYGYPSADEMEHRGGSSTMGRASSSYVAPFDQETAEHWLKGLKNSDGTRGPHWPLEITKQIQAQRGIDCDPIEFWAAMNIMYSDYYGVAKANNAHNQAFYADMAKAFLEDKDAEDDKLALYYKYVVKK